MARPRTIKLDYGEFPPPPCYRVEDSDRGKNSWKLFSYWKELLPELAQQTELWVYRCWPRIDVKLANPKATSLAIEIIPGPCPLPDPKEYEEYFRAKFGVGDYRADLKQRGGVQLMKAYWNNREDMDSHPPKLDMRTLIRDLPANESYYNWCRRNGVKLPWENDGEEEEMTNGSAMSEALRITSENLVRMAERSTQEADRRVEIVEEATRERMERMKEDGPNPIASAAQRSIEMVTVTAKEMVAMATERSGKPHDTIEIFKAVAELMPKPTSEHGMFSEILGEIRAANSAVVELYKGRTERLENLVEKFLTERTEPAPAPPPAKSLIDQLAEYEAIGKALGWKKEGESRALATTQDSQPAGPPQAHWFNEQTAPIIMMGAQLCFGLFANMVHNWSVGQFKPEGQKPQSPGEALETIKQQMANQPDPNAQAQPRDQAAELAEQERQTQESWQVFMGQIQVPLVQLFLRRDPSGYMMAEFLLTEGKGGGAETAHGRATYNAVLKLGRKGFEKQLQDHHEIWSKVQGMRSQLAKFLDELFDFDAEVKRRAAEPAKVTPNGAAQAA